MLDEKDFYYVINKVRYLSSSSRKQIFSVKMVLLHPGMNTSSNPIEAQRDELIKMLKDGSRLFSSDRDLLDRRLSLVEVNRITYIRPACLEIFPLDNLGSIPEYK